MCHPCLQAMNSTTGYLNAVNFPDTMVRLQPLLSLVHCGTL